MWMLKIYEQRRREEEERKQLEAQNDKVQFEESKQEEVKLAEKFEQLSFQIETGKALEGKIMATEQSEEKIDN